MTDKTKPNLVLRARAAAVNALIANHEDEFNDLMVTESLALGIKFTPAKTAEQKAAEQIEALYEKFPNLRPQPTLDGLDTFAKA